MSAGGVRDEREAAARFRQRHARLGVILSLATIVLVAAYAWFGQPKADRATILALSAGSAALTAGLWVIAPQAVRHHRHALFFFAWSAATVALVLVGTAVDGGADSPIAHLLFLPLLYAALAYRPSVVLVLGAVEVSGFLAVGFSDGASNSPDTTFMAATLGIAALMAARSAHNREDQASELRELAVQLESQAVHDGLTACLNRRGFDAALDTELSRAVRYGRPLSLLIMDLDNLKAINDERGHPGGDTALQQVAAALGQAGRRTDIGARLGGDEFALLMPETDMGGALEVAGRMHAALRRTPGVPVTVSIGAAGLGQAVTTTDQLLRAADRALYAAKDAGRNRTASFDVDPKVRRGA
jgi:diguanylate cyclase (GGDEF)-like protein